MKINVESTTEQIESKGGLLLAGKLASYMGLSKIISALKGNAGEVLTHLLGLLVQGQTSYAAMNSFRHNEFFKESFGLTTLFSADTLRLYLDALADDAQLIMKQIQECSNRLLKKARLTGIQIGKKKYIPIDIDTSPTDNSGTKKENIGYTYKGFAGYHPIFAYIGLEGYMLSCQLRPGSRHCRKETPGFIPFSGRMPRKYNSFLSEQNTPQRTTCSTLGTSCLPKLLSLLPRHISPLSILINSGCSSSIVSITQNSGFRAQFGCSNFSFTAQIAYSCLFYTILTLFCKAHGH
jgi:hypothetical protein